MFLFSGSHSEKEKVTGVMEFETLLEKAKKGLVVPHGLPQDPGRRMLRGHARHRRAGHRLHPHGPGQRRTLHRCTGVRPRSGGPGGREEGRGRLRPQSGHRPGRAGPRPLPHHGPRPQAGRRHRDQRQDDHHLYPGAPAGLQRAEGRRARHGQLPLARLRHGRPPDHPGLLDDPRAALQHEEGGRGRGHHGGLLPRAGPVPRGRAGLRRGGVHQPDPGPPGLPQVHGIVFQGQVQAVRRVSPARQVRHPELQRPLRPQAAGRVRVRHRLRRHRRHRPGGAGDRPPAHGQGAHPCP